MIGADIIADVFVKEGIEKFYVFPGGTIAPVIDSCLKRGIGYVCARHEQGAGYMALAHARLLNKPQVVMVTSGPGATNIVTPVADAYFDSTPLIVITGQVGRGDMRKDRRVRQRGFQETETVAMMKPISKEAIVAENPEDLRSLFHSAFRMASTGRSGPVVIDLPMDVQRATIEKENPILSLDAANPSVLSKETLDQINQLVEWLEQAERPTLLAGNGILLSKATEELRRLSINSQIPVVSSLLGLSSFPSNHELSMSFLGHTGTQYANLAIHQADLVVALGARLDVRQTGTKVKEFVPKGKVVRVDIDPGELENSRVKCDLAIQADCKEVLQQVLLRLNNKKTLSHKKWIEQCIKWKESLSLHNLINGDGLHPQHIIEKVSELLGNKKCICVSGVGSHQQWVARHFNFDYPRRRWLTSGGHGAMGYDLPSAIGAKMTDPLAEVICFVGDGSLQINIQELATLIEYKVPVKIVVLDNKRLGIVSQFQNLNWNSDPTTGNKWNPPFNKIAEAYGIPGYSLNRSEDMNTILVKFLAEPGPALIHCEINVTDDVTPMLLANQTMDLMWPYDKIGFDKNATIGE